jgi:lipopolysaccharide/colanic/teichoic acid biosynthesis glycosyltransferase
MIYTNKSDYITPTNKFYENYSMFYAYILLLKPLNNRGKIYSWQTHPIKILVSVCLAILLLPVMLILLFVSILKIFISGIYPPTLGNLNKNLKEFYKFVSK